MTKEDSSFIKGLKKGNIDTYKTIFNKYYQDLFYFCLKFVYQKEPAEEIVQDVFIVIWEKRKVLNIATSLKSYLYTAVKNKSISYLRSKLQQNNVLQIAQNDTRQEINNTSTMVEFNELNDEIKKAINALPERCRIIFNLSRNSGLTYKQIAKELSISPETVKTQIGIALSKIKLHLAIHWETINI